MEMENILPPVSVLVLNYNGLCYLENFMKSIMKTDYPNFKIVFVDNGSTDGSLEFIKKNYPDVQIIAFENNYGFAEAYNRSIEIVNSEILLLINNDIEVDKNWLKELVSHISDDGVASIAPKIKFIDNKEVINSAGGNCDIYGVAWNRGNGEKDLGQYDRPDEVFYVNGAVLIFKKSVWKDVGPFDSRYFMYAEEVDWCWRARLKGYKVIYVPNSVVFHKWQGSSKKTPFVYLMERNWLCNMLKNYEVKTLIQVIPIYAFLETLKSIWLAFKGKTNERFVIPKAVLWNLKNLKGTLQRRKQIQ
ncbi:MAG: glycosyltransferase family 2 protein, partial [Candidatus Jordarchaeaceae archaeon]